MDETQVTASPRKPHPAAAYHEQRKAEVTFRALTVARELIETEGLAAFTVERVAERSGIAKTTLYRRWDNSLALARDAYDVREGEVKERAVMLQLNAGSPFGESPVPRAAVLAASVAERLGETKR